MARFSHPLKYVRVAAPCPASWERMLGNDRVRFCDQCNLNVYNLSALTKRDAERLIMSTEGRLCVRFYRRADGSILTQNCPTGLRALKRRVTRLASGVMTAVLSFFASIGVFSLVDETEIVRPHTMGTLALEVTPVPPPFNGPVATTGQLIADDSAQWVQGDIAAPATVGHLRVVQPTRRHNRRR
ncbi:MAG: hypothetical protein ACJ74W_08150 [Pyrinomonadaceae bacterium]